MFHYYCLTSYIPKKALDRVSNRTEISPAREPLISLYPEDEVTHSAEALKQDIHNNTPSTPITYLGENQTAKLPQIEDIFNTENLHLKKYKLRHLRGWNINLCHLWWWYQHNNPQWHHFQTCYLHNVWGWKDRNRSQWNLGVHQRNHTNRRPTSFLMTLRQWH